MPKSTSIKTRLSEKSIKILRKYRNGLSVRSLRELLVKEHPEININTIRGIVWDIPERYPRDVYRPKKGIFRHTTFRK